MHIFSRPSLPGLLFGLILLAGCSKPEPPATIPEQMAVFGNLPGLRESHHEGLQAELARLEDENATPAQLYSGPTEEEVRLGIQRVEDNAAVAIEPLWDDETKRQAVVSQILRLLPPLTATGAEATLVEPGHRSILDEVVQAQRSELEQFREAVRGGACDFMLDFRQGCFADLSFVEKCELASLLEFAIATKELDAGELNQALDCVGRILLTARLLSQEKYVVPRLTAADVRRRALAVAGGILAHPAATPRYSQQLYEMIDAELLQWPADELAWIGDRAVGLHTYEVVRDRQLLSLLSEEELDEWSAQADIRETAKHVYDSVDSDEAFYLQTMRAMIEACRLPYYRRRAFFTDLTSQLKAQAGRDDFPLVADRLLLADVQRGHRRQAEDKVLMDAWLLGLATVLGRETSTPKVSPITGEPLAVRKVDDGVIVSGLFPADQDEPLKIPKP